LKFRRSARILAALIALAVFALAALAFVGIDIDAQRWREPMAAALSRALGREVWLEGPARLTVSLHPDLAVGGIRIANPPDFDAPDLARIGELRLAMDLLPLLRGEIRVRELRGRDVTVRLVRSSDGRGNWRFGAAARDAPAPDEPVERPRLDVHRVSLEDVRIEYVGEGATRRFDLAELTGEARAGQPARLSLRGTVETQFAYTIAAELDVASDRTAVNSINGVIGATRVSGALVLDTGGPRPRLTGRLAFSELDLRPLLARAPGDEGKAPETIPDTFRELQSVDFDLRRLAWLDTDVQLEVGRWAGVPGDVRDLSATLRIDAGRLTVPLKVMVAGARFEGDLTADGTTTPARMRAHLAARESPLGGLAELVFDAPYVAGTLRRFDLRLDAAGNSAAALVRDLEGRITFEGARFTYGNYTGGRPVEMRLDAVELSQRRGKTIAGKLRGALRGKPFDGTFRAGTIERVLRERQAPFGFDGTSGSVRARLSGTLAEPTETTGVDVAFDVAAPRARELTPWLGFSSQSDARVALKGTVQVRRRHVSLTGGSLLVGRTSITGDVSWQPAGRKALVTANLLADVLAPAELKAATAPPGMPRRATVLEIPILPESLDFADSDLEVRVKRVDGLRLRITDVVFQGRMRDGEITPSPFSLRMEGNALAGALALDARGDTPTASLWLAGDDFNVGTLLRRLRVARDVDSRIGTVRLYADIRERRLGDVLEQSSFVANIEAGTLDFRDANTRAALRIAVDAGEVRADPGGPVIASVTGTAGSTPVALKAQAGRLREFVDPAERLPFSLTAETPAAKLAISGTAAPERDPAVALSLALTGERLDGLDPLFETSLPPWGPYALTARARLAKRGYEVDAMRLALGESILAGRGALDTARAPPKLDVSLAAERIQLDDFPLADWSPFEPRAAPGGPLTVETARQAVAAGTRRAHAVFSREFLRKADADVEVLVKRVVSGADQLGRGRFVAAVANGRATIGPIEVETGAGSARGSLVYEPRERDVLVDAYAKIDRLDYGVLARRVRPGADFDGAVSLDLRVAATAPRLSDALATGSGRLDFAVWPKRLQAGALDLRSASLLISLLPFVERGVSFMNCTVGQFDLKDGTLHSVRLVIDTTNTRAEGAGTVSFATDEIRLRIAPRPKVPQFFSRATPFDVSGTFADYRFSARTADVLGMAVRWVASPVVVPIQRLLTEPAPADGHDVCSNPGR
jgi:uncharacterized protein involved in outer membrane biogenesis